MKYYFITYQAESKDGHVAIWNQVINTSPMKFILDVEKAEEKSGGVYYNFNVINTCEISRDEFKEFDGQF